MAKRREPLTAEFIRDYWLKKYHGIDTAWLIENEPILIQTPDWYKKYAVTKEQHDEWYEWAIDTIAKYNHISKKLARRGFAFDYLNLAPSEIRKDNG
jgi:hypothetical protein